MSIGILLLKIKIKAKGKKTNAMPISLMNFEVFKYIIINPTKEEHAIDSQIS